jgi:glycosyltransferase involved in cell wall biosynthesis
MLSSISSKVKIVHLPIERDIKLVADLKSLLLLTLIFYKNKFSLVHSVSPKAGLLASIASWVTFTPNRLHTFTGQVWLNKKGVSRWFLKSLDKVISLINTNILVDSYSQQNFLIKENILSRGSSFVLGNGSIGGVDINRFKPSKKWRNKMRKSLNIKDECLVFLFVGRLKKEKGLFELIEAFKNIRVKNENVELLIVGQDEEELKGELIKYLGVCSEFVKFIDFTYIPEKYMMASDIFILPSYREGFGTAVIEAAACGLPSIGSNIYGLSDAIKDGETGFLVPPRRSKVLESQMMILVDNKKILHKMSFNSRNYAVNNFSQEYVTAEIIQLYKKLLSN